MREITQSLKHEEKKNFAVYKENLSKPQKHPENTEKRPDMSLKLFDQITLHTENLQQMMKHVGGLLLLVKLCSIK